MEEAGRAIPNDSTKGRDTYSPPPGAMPGAAHGLTGGRGSLITAKQGLLMPALQHRKLSSDSLVAKDT